MAKILKVTFPQKCIGCDLCILEVQRQLGKVGLDNSPIRVFKQKGGEEVLDDLTFEIDLDASVNNLDIKKIQAICPTQVFTLEETSEYTEENLLEQA